MTREQRLTYLRYRRPRPSELESAYTPPGMHRANMGWGPRLKLEKAKAHKIFWGFNFRPPDTFDFQPCDVVFPDRKSKAQFRSSHLDTRRTREESHLTKIMRAWDDRETFASYHELDRPIEDDCGGIPEQRGCLGGI